MCSDGAGGAYFVWVETEYESSTKTTYYHLKANKITSSGSKAWGENGKDVIPRTESSITLPRICAGPDRSAKIVFIRNAYADLKRKVELVTVDTSGQASTPEVIEEETYARPDIYYDYRWTGLNLSRGDGYIVVTMKHQYTTYAYKWRTSSIEELYVKRVPDVG